MPVPAARAAGCEHWHSFFKQKKPFLNSWLCIMRLCVLCEARPALWDPLQQIPVPALQCPTPKPWQVWGGLQPVLCFFPCWAVAQHPSGSWGLQRQGRKESGAKSIWCWLPEAEIVFVADHRAPYTPEHVLLSCLLMGKTFF